MVPALAPWKPLKRDGDTTGAMDGRDSLTQLRPDSQDQPQCRTGSLASGFLRLVRHAARFVPAAAFIGKGRRLAAVARYGP